MRERIVAAIVFPSVAEIAPSYLPPNRPERERRQRHALSLAVDRRGEILDFEIAGARRRRGDLRRHVRFGGGLRRSWRRGSRRGWRERGGEGEQLVDVEAVRGHRQIRVDRRLQFDDARGLECGSAGRRRESLQRQPGAGER
jgi:hypothetical protein